MDNEIGDAEYKESHQMNFGNASYVNENKTSQNYDMEILTYNEKEIDEYVKEHKEASIDYIHGLDNLASIASENKGVAIIMPKIKKNAPITCIVKNKAVTLQSICKTRSLV